VCADAPYHPPLLVQNPYEEIHREGMPGDSEMKVQMLNGVFRVYADEERLSRCGAREMPLEVALLVHEAVG